MRVGHRIIEINNQSVVAVPHEKIVNLLATSVGEVCIARTHIFSWTMYIIRCIPECIHYCLQINMKTMPTSMFRLLTGQETPLYI